MTTNYDFIVVGGGSSGALLADNLSKKGSTLLVERGPPAETYPQHMVPQGWPQIIALTFDQIRAKDSGHWSGTARVMGGGSTLNAAACWRGKYEIFQDLGFTRDEVEAAYAEIEDKLTNPAGDSEFNDAFLKAWQSLGYDVGDTTTAGQASWISQNNSTSSSIQVQRSRSSYMRSKDGRRQPASTVLDMDNPNLTVMTLSAVKKVVLNDNKVATSVQIESLLVGNFTASVRKGGKIFLNAGAFETPKLLMLSGIGPAETLRQYGIEVLHDNPAVGRNAIDRKELLLGLPLLKNLQGEELASLDFAAFTPDYWMSYVHRQTAPWGNAVFGCLTCSPINRVPECADKLMAGLGLFGMAAAPSEFRDLPGVYVAQRNPSTRGYVTLASDNHQDNPEFYDGWNSTGEMSPDASQDLDMLVEATMELVIKLVDNGELYQHFGHSITNTSGPFPATTQARLDSLQASIADIENQAPECFVNQDWLISCTTWEDCVPTMPPLSRNLETLRDAIKNMVSSSQHIAGTSKVGEVVHPRTLEVIGIRNLHVADLSVVGRPVDIYPMLTAMAIGHIVGELANPIPKPDIEYGPICVAIVLSIFAVAFSIFSYLLAIRKRKIPTSHRASLDNHLTKSGRNIHLKHQSLNFGTSVRVLQVQKSQQEQTLEDRPLLSWKNLQCSYDPTKMGGKVKLSLAGLCGTIRERELIAIMGPSGAGKSTLMDILSQRKTLGNLRGEMSIFGEYVPNISTAKTVSLEKVSAYIPQHESFFPTQTPEEAVLFMADLRLGKDPKGFDRRQELVRLCLQKVGLSVELWARPIGGVLAGGLTLRGLSGGERKRLALACALAMKPKILFLDEITSGLDSVNALATVTLLKRICHSDAIAAVMVIHQPGADVFQAFDRLVLLSNGKCIYNDKASELELFYTDTLSVDFPNRHELAEDLLNRAKEWRKNEEPVELEPKEEFALVQTTSEPLECIEMEMTVSAYWKFQVIFLRNLLNQYIRNPTNVAARLFIYAALSLVNGAIYWQVADPSELSKMEEANHAAVVLGAFTYLLLTSYLLPFATIPIFVHEKKFFVAESDLSLYSPWMYCISQSILELWVLTIAAFLEAIIVTPMIGLWNPVLPRWTSFFTVLSTLIVSGMVGSANVLFNAIVMPSQDVAFLNGSAFVTICLAVSGGFVPLSELPSYISWLQWISPAKYSLQSLARNQFEGSNMEVVLLRSGLDQPDSISINIAVLYGMYIGLALATMLALSRQREVR